MDITTMEVSTYTEKEIVDNFQKYMFQDPSCIPETILGCLEKINPGTGDSNKEKQGKPVWDRMIELGCGNGRATLNFSPYFHSVIGIDISEAQIEKAKEVHPSKNVQYLVGKSEVLPAQDNSVDLITSVFAVQDMDVEKSVLECRRVLKPNGIAVFYTFALYDLQLAVDGSVKSQNATSNSGPSSAKHLWEKFLNKAVDFALSIKNSEYHILTGYQAIYESIEGMEKRKIDDLQFPMKLTFHDWKHYYLSLPFFMKFEKAFRESYDYVGNFFRDLKELWGIQDHEETTIEIETVYSASMILLTKRDQ